MIEVFGCIILTAFAVNGIVIATGFQMLLEPVKNWLDKRVGKRKIYKPLIGCVKCMPSIYGTAICLLFLPITWQLIFVIPVVILCSSTLAAIIHTLYI